MAGFQNILYAGLAGCLLGLASGQVYAADASPWAEDNYAAARLIAGSAQGDGKVLRAGIEIRMRPGWHTYWRYPGDSGIPPRFDFTGSTNLASAEVLFPAPHLLTDETGNSIGYAGDVVFPLRVTPREPGKPVSLRLKFDYAVCEKLCVPEEGHMTLDLTGGASGNDARLAKAEARVPKPVTVESLSLSVRRVHDGPKPQVTVDFKAADGKPVQVFAEGPTPEWALPVPQPAQTASANKRRFQFALDGLPPGTDPKGPVALTLTVVEGANAYEVKTRLD